MHWLLRRFEERGDRPALLGRGPTCTYRDLLHATLHWQKRLEELDCERGARIAVVGDFGREPVALLLALATTGRVAVPLTDQDSETRARYARLAQVTRIFDFSLDPEAGRSARVVESPAPVNALYRTLADRDAAGLVLFSSGSTGEPKATLLDLDRLLEKFHCDRRGFRTITFLLLDHIGGINTLLHALAHGGAIVPVAGRSADAVCRAIEEHGVELLPTTPTFLNMLLISGAHRRHDLSSLQTVTYGTESMPASTLTALRSELPEVRLKQTYGLSEVGILRTRSRDDGSLWMQVGGEGYEVEVRDGTLFIRARSAMLGYLNAPSPFDAEGWLNTHDRVETDGPWLRILGRDTDIINVGGEKVYAAEVESVLLELDNVADAVVVGRANPVTGQVVAARVTLVEPEPLRSLRRRIRAHCKGRLEPFKTPRVVEIVDGALHGARFKRARA